MNKNLKLRAIVWEIIVPIVLYYIVFLSAMYFIFAFIGHTASTYMIAQIISAAITIPFMYFASYKPTQQMFVKKPKIGTFYKCALGDCDYTFHFICAQ